MNIVVLIVDKSEAMRELIKLTLEGVATIAGECSDGSEAMSAYEQLRPDWVLMDIDMDDVDGITATRQITAAHPLANIMIVADYNDADLRRAARDAGARRYIVKEDLLDIVDILLKGEMSG